MFNVKVQTLPEFDGLRDLLHAVSEGKQSLRVICKELGVDAFQFWQLRRDNPAVEEAYQDAVEIAGDGLAMRAVEVAEGASYESLGVDKFRTETLKWAASRMNKRQWGDKAGVAVTVNTAVRISDVISEAVADRTDAS